MTTQLYRRNQLFQNRAYMSVRRPGVALELGTAAFNLFTIANGLVAIKALFGHSTELIAGTCLPRLQFTPTGGALTPLCVAAVDIDADVANSFYTWTGLVGGTLTVGAVIGVSDLNANAQWSGGSDVLVPGIISLTDATAAAVTGGLIDWYVIYMPLVDTAEVTIL